MGTVDPKMFKNGRQFAAWIGLAPRQYSSGEVNHIGGNSKRGNSSLRRLLIHGARSVLNWSNKKEDKLSLWLKDLQKRMPANKAAVALANKLARIIWSVLSKNEIFNMKQACA